MTYLKYMSVVIIACLGLLQGGGQMTALDEALRNARLDHSRADYFYNLFLKSEVYIPTDDAADMKSGERRAEHNERFTPVIINSNGKKYLPIFDSEERLRKWAKRPVNFVRIAVHALLHDADTNVHIVLNLGTEHYKEFVSEELKLLQDAVRGLAAQEKTVRSRTRAFVGAPAKVPEGLEEALRSCLSKSKEVKAAYLGWILIEEKSEQPHFVVVIEIESVTETVFSAISKEVGISIMGLLKEGEYLDVLRYSEQGPAAAIVKQVRPFYVRAK